MLNAAFVLLVLVSVLAAAASGRMEALSTGILDDAGRSVQLALGLIGALSFFLGLMRVVQDGGALRLLARAAAPVMRRLFRGVPADHPAMSAMLLSIASNILGLGSAATPFGIRAMQELDTLNPRKGVATNAMVTFLSINTAGFAILPTTVLALRASAGSKAPGSILAATWFASGCATIVGIASAILLSRLPWFKATDPGVMPPSMVSSEAVDAPPQTRPAVSRFIPWIAGGYIVILIGVLIRAASTMPAGELARTIMSYWTLPLLVALIVLFGWARGVKVYEVFLEGAKEGFQVALRIIPYLLAIVVAVGMFRASGCLDVVVQVLSPLTSPLGLPAEAVPLAVLRPLSGSGAYGVMSEIVTTHGPDSYLGILASTMQGSTDTTFYILSVYFGAVGIKKTRHAVLAGLLTDAAGIAAAVFICRLVWHG
ncbi:MAG TPA: nucleoside recognition domain-containing protein [Candidatus Polarisedimenticolaceae bacterium]|nr:nucleoside recognition domain-containing protein [Candidatus Polarisedimenticolaceae bacterium]